MRKEVAVAAVSTTLAVAGVVALVRQWRRRKEQELRRARNIVLKFARESATPLNKLWQVADDLVSHMKASLASHPTNESTILNMLISYVASLPNGEEDGLFYGVNLRGTDFLILCAQLRGKNMPISDLNREQIPFPPNILAGTSQELFDFIAREVAKFVLAHPENGNGELPKQQKLGFTLSYPVEQAEAFSGSVIRWKSFSVDDPVGKELVNDLNRALKDHGMNMQVFATVDDAIGDLAGGRYYSRDSVAAIALGMTTNAAYVEPPQAVPRWQRELPNSSELVISTEWRNFNSSHLPATQFDACLDAASSNPKSGIFGKLISGLYLGEIVRLVLLKIAQETSIFGEVPQKLMTPYVLWSPDMAAMHQDTSEDRDVVSDKLNEVFGISNCTAMAREVVAEVCDIVTERGARLAGAGIVAIIKKLERIEHRRSVVTVEGGLYDHYRIFRNYLHSSVWEMLGKDLSDNIIIEHSHGGSGTGALFLAASQAHLPNS